MLDIIEINKSKSENKVHLDIKSTNCKQYLMYFTTQTFLA